jgi:hypothetical protein
MASSVNRCKRKKYSNFRKLSQGQSDTFFGSLLSGESLTLDLTNHAVQSEAFDHPLLNGPRDPVQIVPLPRLKPCTDGFDPPPPPPPQVVKPDPPKLNAKLMATAVDRGQPTAMFRIPSGRFMTLKVGDTFDNEPGTAKIVGLDGKQVTLQFEGFEEQTTIGIK